jgi:YD repeat-containing protein
VTHYTYENVGGTPKRPLVTGISWSVPQGSGIAVPTAVSYSFDNAGNRTGMTDALGTVAYTYDELSRMTSEARNFSDTLADEPASGVYEVQYTYGLAGGLLSYTDPFGEEIGYSNDKLGRLSSVTGSSFGGVTSYIDGIQYRAWGGFKYASYGNNMESFLSYNDQLQPEGYLLRNSTNYSQKLFDREYEYLADGKLSLMDDNTSQYSYKYDRSFKFDHLGRVTKALSGVEATGGTETDLTKLPYRQSYAWNAFGNLEERESTLWNYPQGDWDFDHTVTNNRRQGTNYDNDARVTQDNGIYFTFDAAGSMITTWRYMAYHMTMTADGDGNEGKRFRKQWDTLEEDWDEGETRYMVYSSVLGQIVSEANGTGKKYRTMVVGAGSTIARQGIDHDDNEAEIVGWEHRDPNGLSTRSYPVFGLLSQSKPTDIEEELDGLGNNVGAIANLAPPQRGNGSPYDNVTIMSPAEQMCMEGGVFGPCEVFDGIDDAELELLSMLGRRISDRMRAARYRQGFGRNNPLPTAIGPQMRRDRSPDTINHAVLQAIGFLDSLFYYRSPRNDMSHRFAAMETLESQSNFLPDWQKMPSMEAFRKELVNILDDNEGRCRAFLDSVRKNLGINGTIEDLFDKLIKNGGAVVMDERISPAHGKAYWGRKGRDIGLGPVNDRWERYVTKGIHELLHREGKDHASFARAAFRSLTADEQEESPLPTKKSPGSSRDTTFSVYFTRLLNERCPAF